MTRLYLNEEKSLQRSTRLLHEWPHFAGRRRLGIILIYISSSIAPILSPSAKPGHYRRSSRQCPFCQNSRNFILKFIMSKTVHIGSQSQFASLLQSSKIVVTDCMSQVLTYAPLRACPCHIARFPGLIG